MKKTKKYNAIAFFTIFILVIGLFFGFSNVKVSATGSVNLFDANTAVKLNGGASFSVVENEAILVSQNIKSTYFSANVLISNDLIGKTVTLSAKSNTSAENKAGLRIQWVTNSGVAAGDMIEDEPDSAGNIAVTGQVPSQPDNEHSNLCLMFYSNTSGELETGTTYTATYSDIQLVYTQGDLYRFNSYEEMKDITFGNTSTTPATWGNLYLDDFRGYWDINYFTPGGTAVLFKMETPSETAGAKREIILYIDYSYNDPDVILQFRDNNIKLLNIYIYSGGSGNWDFATANNELNTFMQSTNTVWKVVDYWGNFLSDDYPYEMPFYSFGSIVATIICNSNIPGVEPTILTNQNNFENIPDLNSSDFSKTTEQGDDYQMAWGGWFYDSGYTLPVKRADLVGNQEYNIYAKWTNEWMDGWTVGHRAGSNIDIDDYIKKSDGTSWITAFFGAFSSFFAIKLGSVSLGAIILIPVSISVVWFVIKMFRGGS